MGAKTLPFLAGVSPGRTSGNAPGPEAVTSVQSATTSAPADRVVYVYSDKIEVRSHQVKYPEDLNNISQRMNSGLPFLSAFLVFPICIVRMESLTLLVPYLPLINQEN